MELTPEVPIWRTVAAGYRAGISVLVRDGALFRYFIYASVLSLPIVGIQYVVEQAATPTMQVLKPLFSLLTYVAYAMALSPLTAAIHRKLLLGESPRQLYFAAMFRTTELRLAVATIAVSALFLTAELMAYPLVYLLYGVSPFDAAGLAQAYEAQPLIAMNLAAAMLIAYLVAGLAATRFAFAFPAIATQARGASLRQSYVETHGSTWRLFFIFLIIFLFPFLLFIGAVAGTSAAFVIGNPEVMRTPEAGETMERSLPFLVLYAIMFLAMMAMVAVTAAAAARAYEIRINRGMSGVAEVFA
ncbi:MAG: hypothetical protein AB7S71_03925 [Dongiaceae bacterium]